MDKDEESLFQGAVIAGFNTECGGGGSTVLFLETPEGYTISFGFANGPLGYDIAKDCETGEMLEIDGFNVGGEMEKEGATAEEMAAFIKEVADKWKAFQTWKPN